MLYTCSQQGTRNEHRPITRTVCPTWEKWDTSSWGADPPLGAYLQKPSFQRDKWPTWATSTTYDRGRGSTRSVHGEMNAERSHLGRWWRMTAMQKNESMPSTGTSQNPLSEVRSERTLSEAIHVSKNAHRQLVQERTNKQTEPQKNKLLIPSREWSGPGIN